MAAFSRSTLNFNQNLALAAPQRMASSPEAAEAIA
jgi:hypothetical protein